MGHDKCYPVIHIRLHLEGVQGGFSEESKDLASQQVLVLSLSFAGNGKHYPIEQLVNLALVQVQVGVLAKSNLLRQNQLHIAPPKWGHQLLSR